MERVETARDLVLGYVRALNTVDEAMRVALPSLDRLADLLGLARSRRISRSDRIGVYSYTVHGAGCRSGAAARSGATRAPAPGSGPGASSVKGPSFPRRLPG